MSITHYRARVAALSRSRAADDPDLIAARQGLEAARLTGLADEIATAATKLDDTQRNRIVEVLRSGGLA